MGIGWRGPSRVDVQLGSPTTSQRIPTLRQQHSFPYHRLLLSQLHYILDALTTSSLRAPAACEFTPPLALLDVALHVHLHFITGRATEAKIMLRSAPRSPMLTLCSSLTTFTRRATAQHGPAAHLPRQQGAHKLSTPRAPRWRPKTNPHSSKTSFRLSVFRTTS